jgi:hypothetical protein
MAYKNTAYSSSAGLSRANVPAGSGAHPMTRCFHGHGFDAVYQQAAESEVWTINDVRCEIVSDTFSFFGTFPFFGFNTTSFCERNSSASFPPN